MLLTAVPLSAAWAASEPSAEDLARLKQTIQRLRQELERQQSSRSALDDELKRSELKVAELHRRIERLRSDVAERKSRLQELSLEEAGLQQRLDEQRQVFERQLQTAYLMNRESRLKLLLDQDNPQRLARLMAYYDYLARANRNQLDAFVADLRRLGEVTSSVAAEAASLQANRDDLEQRQQKLVAAQETRRATLAKLDREIGSSRNALEKMDRERKQLETLLEEMSRALADIELASDVPAFTAAKGRMPWPATGRLRNSFGSRRGSGGLRWQGVTIGADEGSEVQAIHHGRVVYADWLRGSGLLLILDHGDGYMSLYAHNQQLLRETGEWVRTGEVIARVGASGGQQRAGLYFEIRRKGAPMDPIIWCRRRT